MSFDRTVAGLMPSHDDEIIHERTALGLGSVEDVSHAEIVAAARLARSTWGAAERKRRLVRRSLLCLARAHLIQARILRASGKLAESLDEIRLARGLRRSARLTNT